MPHAQHCPTLSFSFYTGQSASLPLKPLGTSREQRNMSQVLTHCHSTTRRNTPERSFSLELKVWMKLCLNYQAGYKLEYLRHRQKPVLMKTETVTAGSISNHLLVPRSNSDSIHCFNAVFPSTVGKLVFNKFFMLSL